MDDIRLRVAQLYERERESAPMAFSSEDIPCSYDAVTVEWLTAILCRDYPGARAVSFSLDQPDDGFSERRRIYIKYNSVGEDALLPPSVFCKASHSLTSRLAFACTGCGANEVNFYRSVRKNIAIEAPECYFAHYHADSFATIIVLKDMREAEFCQDDTDVTKARASEIVSLLAKLHGGFSDPRRMAELRSGFPTWPEFWRRLEALGIQEACRVGLINAEEVIPVRLFTKQDAIWTATLRSVERHLSLPATFTHGDCHLKNWYTRCAHIGLMDWQGACLGHWSRDIAYALSTALTVENRRLWDRELISEYLDCLYANGGPKVSFGDAWHSYRQQLFTAMAYWTSTLGYANDSVHPVSTKLKFVGRMARAIDDLESLSTLP